MTSARENANRILNRTFEHTIGFYEHNRT
jgi:hypothetical protein